MKDVLEKLSSYNIFNNLFPGIIFVLLLKMVTIYDLIQNDIIIGVFLYYFVGLVISRIGSIIIEPILRKIGFIKFSEYKNYLKASKKNPDIKLFSEINNMYRTILAVFILLFVIKFYEYISTKIVLINNWTYEIIIVLLFCLFLFSYRKQTKFVVDRISLTLKGGKK